ncbi:type II toxin-antitoxin system VapC family toxin [Lacunimicrobium album]
MSPSLVLDCSMVMAWLFHDEQTELTDRVQQMMLMQAAVVPSIWSYEVANVLLTAQKKKRITEQDANEFVSNLMVLEIYVDVPSKEEAFDKTLAMARENQLTSYDAAYLELANRLAIPLATLDKDLIRGATSLGVPIVK